MTTMHTVDTARYRAAHKAEPEGVAFWLFLDRSADKPEPLYWRRGLYAEAVERAIAYARRHAPLARLELVP